MCAFYHRAVTLMWWYRYCMHIRRYHVINGTIVDWTCVFFYCICHFLLPTSFPPVLSHPFPQGSTSKISPYKGYWFILVGWLSSLPISVSLFPLWWFTVFFGIWDSTFVWNNGTCVPNNGTCVQNNGACVPNYSVTYWKSFFIVYAVGVTLKPVFVGAFMVYPCQISHP